MSAVSSEFGATERRSGPEPPEESLSRQAKLYLFTVAAIAVVVALVPLSHLKPGSHGWPTFLVLASCAAIAQLFVVRTPRDQSYHTTIVFLIPAAMLLPPELVALMGVVQHIPEWLKVRYPWYIQGFNIANYTLNGLAAWGAVQIVESWNLNPDVTFALAGLAASVVFVTLNHVLLATMLHFARGHTLRETGLFSCREPLDRLRPRSARRRLRGHLDVEPMAPSDRRRPAPPDPPLAERPRPPGGGARRSEDRPLQRALLRRRARARSWRARAGSTGRCRSSWPTSTFSGTSTTPTATSPATPSSRGSQSLPQAAAALRRSRPVRWGGVRHPPARDPAGAGARDRRAHPAGGCRPALRGRDVERADPRHDLPRRRGLPEGRDRPERAHPPGRPRRLPRQAPGPKPRPGRELRAAAPLAHGAPGQARSRT